MADVNIDPVDILKDAKQIVQNAISLIDEKSALLSGSMENYGEGSTEYNDYASKIQQLEDYKVGIVGYLNEIEQLNQDVDNDENKNKIEQIFNSIKELNTTIINYTNYITNNETAGAGGVPQVDDKNEVLLEKVEGIKSMLGQNGNFSLEPKIDENTVTLVAISKDKNGIKYDTITINNIDAEDYMKGEHTYNQPAKSQGMFSMFGKSTGGNKHFKTIRNKNRNYRKTEKAGKKHVSKRKRVLLNKHRKTHHK